LASPKGGAGKTTSAVLLATELAQSGAAVAVIDADPNRNISEWAARPCTARGFWDTGLEPTRPGPRVKAARP
jgi:chromosome partitioning protein